MPSTADELDTLRAIAAIAVKLRKASYEAYIACDEDNGKGKHHSNWDEYDTLVLPLWKDLDGALKHLANG